MTFSGTVLEGVSCRPGDRSNMTRIAVRLLATAPIGGLITSTLLTGSWCRCCIGGSTR
ncbi:MAG: hypothetical protein K2Y35_13005 [Burkholderiales bacterium]|nr:hypothetical protein [Burkholderiales bacterium]